MLKIGTAKKLDLGSIIELADEPCRICGENIGRARAVWVGYSMNDEARAAHRSCWYKNVPKEQWAYPKDKV